MSIGDEKPFEILALENVRCFGSVKVPLHPRVTVVIGENGTGKTTVAEALASMSYGDDEGLPEFPLRHGAKKGRIALYDGAGRRPAAVWTAGAKAERRRLPSERYLFAYGRYRRVRFAAEHPETPTVPDLESALLERRTTTLRRPDNHLLRDLGQYMIELHERRSRDGRADAAWRCFQESLEALGHGLEKLEVEEVDGRLELMVTRGGLRLLFEELSDGYLALLVIVFDLILRYSHFFSSLQNPRRGKAAVVIDEVDLHLHPRWQRRVVGQLAELFPETQFVLTTHSPAVVQGAIDAGFQVVVLREKTGRVAADPLNSGATEGLRGAEIGALWLEKRLFSAQSRYSPVIEAQEREVRELRVKLQKDEESETDRLRLIELLDNLGLLLAKDEERQGRGPFLSELAFSQVEFLRRLEKIATEEGVE